MIVVWTNAGEDEIIVLVFPSSAEFEVFKIDWENSRRWLLRLTI